MSTLYLVLQILAVVARLQVCDDGRLVVLVELGLLLLFPIFCGLDWSIQPLQAVPVGIGPACGVSPSRGLAVKIRVVVQVLVGSGADGTFLVRLQLTLEYLWVLVSIAGFVSLKRRLLSIHMVMVTSEHHKITQRELI